MDCPHCKSKISWLSIASALCPVWIKCKVCNSKLIGSNLIKIQSVFVTLLSILLGVLIGMLDTKIDMKVLYFILGVSIISIPNLWLTIVKGKYRVKDS
jgi:hypothetical protein